jgi:hypothetical protein
VNGAFKKKKGKCDYNREPRIKRKRREGQED